MSTVTARLALPANGVSPSGTLTNTTGTVRLSATSSTGTGPASYQLIKQNADSTAWFFVPNAVMDVVDGGVNQLNWDDKEGSSLYHVVQTRPSGQTAVLTGATVYLSAATVVAQSVGAVSTTTLTASGAIVGQSTLAITGTSTLTGAVSAGSTLAVTGAVTHSSTLTQTGIATFNAAPVFAAGLTASGAIANDFSGGTGTFLTSSGANTLSGNTTAAANVDLLCAAGTSKLDFSLGTGIFKSPSGAGTLSGTTNIAANKNLTCSAGTTALDLSLGTGATLTTTGLNTIGGDLLMSSGKVVGFGAPQALSGAGAVDVVSAVTLFTSTGASQALTLADGTRAGQFKYISHVVDGGSGILTPTTKTNFTTLTLTAVYDWGLLQWSGSAWRPVAFGGSAAFA